MCRVCVQFKVTFLFVLMRYNCVGRSVPLLVQYCISRGCVCRNAVKLLAYCVRGAVGGSPAGLSIVGMLAVLRCLII